jgi:hypothetical protein
LAFTLTEAVETGNDNSSLHSFNQTVTTKIDGHMVDVSRRYLSDRICGESYVEKQISTFQVVTGKMLLCLAVKGCQTYNRNCEAIFSE